MDSLILTPGQRRRLHHQLHGTPDARLYRRTLAILQVSQGIPIAQVARTLGVARRTLYYWIDDYTRAYDPTALADADRPGRPSLWTDALRGRLRALLGQSPQDLGYFAVDWTVPLLQEHLEHCTGQWLSDDTIRRELQRLRYVWKRSRYVLDPDPEREKKKADPPAGQGLAAPERPAG